ncbi:alpha/beta fold hydrolase [Pseudonocardia hierapolitana]|uniref:alpha/beta fold hydrolase n=1 Tax=Pseudonocardia hierapolitana TaxID=1128676 RepID=UPI003CCC5547
MGGSRDSIIPIEHTVAAHNLLPGSRLQIFEGAGHFPHAEQSTRFAELTHFLTDTRAAQSDLQSLRRRLQSSAGLHSPADVPVA